MASGIRAEVKVDAGGACPVTRVASEANAATFSVSRSVDPGSPTRMTEEFMIEGGDADEVDATDEMEAVFCYGSKQVFRFERDLGTGCPCECVEQFDCPVVDIHTHDGWLYLVFHARDMGQLREVITELQERYPGVDVQRLVRSQDGRPGHDLVFVDRGALTDRQREVLETAHRMGYFDHPKGANAGEVAAALDISPSTFAEHLATAQTKLLNAILDE